MVRFLLELCGLAAAAYWGFATFDGALGWVFGLGAPFAVGFAWGTFVAPRAKVQVSYAGKLILGVLILSLCGLALMHAGEIVLGAVYIALVAVNALLTHRFLPGTRRPGAAIFRGRNGRVGWGK